MTTKLAALRKQLAAVGRFRRHARWGTAYAGLLLAVLWLLAVLFLFDWLFEMSIAQRLVAIALAAGVLVWAVRRFVQPWLGHRESELDVALLVESKQKIESDLVAALQFESPDSASWGSPQLQDAVVDYVADFSKNWNLVEGFTREEMRRRLAALAITFAALIAVVIAFPAHTTAFLARLALSSVHYPTDTRIERIVINGREIETLLPAGQITAKCPYGQPLVIEIVCSGELPASGRAELRTVSSGMETIVDLVPAAEPAPAVHAQQRGRIRLQPAQVGVPRWVVAGVLAAANEAADHAEESADHAPDHGAPSHRIDSDHTPADTPAQKTFAGTLPRVVDSLYVQFYLGDAWTEPAQLAVIPLPIVEARLKDTPPDYASDLEKPDPRASARQLSVVEGSRVDVEVECKNKDLREVTLSIADQQYPLVKSDKQGRLWRLDVTDTPLAKVDKPIGYKIHVVDTDAMSPQRQIQGFIRIRADRPPHVLGTLVTHHVLPTAQPKIGIRASDDYGIDEIRLKLEIERGGEAAMEDQTVVVRRGGDPVMRQRLPLREEYALDLAPFELAKGDRVRVTLEAEDFRGRAAGRTAQSDPLILNVTDESGVLSAISESDERSARQLDAIIKRQLGIGGKP